ncbi:unnamed protein product [Lathyrus oleraceus]
MGIFDWRLNDATDVIHTDFELVLLMVSQVHGKSATWLCAFSKYNALFPFLCAVGVTLMRIRWSAASFGKVELQVCIGTLLPLIVMFLQPSYVGSLIGNVLECFPFHVWVE